MATFQVIQEVVRWNEVDAETEDEAIILAAETPPDFWVQEVKAETVVEVGHDIGRR